MTEKSKCITLACFTLDVRVTSHVCLPCGSRFFNRASAIVTGDPDARFTTRILHNRYRNRDVTGDMDRREAGVSTEWHGARKGDRNREKGWRTRCQSARSEELAAGNFRVGRWIQDQACAQPFRRCSSRLSRASSSSSVHAFLQLPNPCSCLKDILSGSESSHAKLCAHRTLVFHAFRPKTQQHDGSRFRRLRVLHDDRFHRVQLLLLHFTQSLLPGICSIAVRTATSCILRVTTVTTCLLCPSLQ